VDYLRERQPALDYNSLKSLSYHLGKRFWQDIEHHHSDADSLRLAPDVIGQWKQRIRTKDKTVTTPMADARAPRSRGSTTGTPSPKCGPSTLISPSGHWKTPAAGARG
jgi:hypothetical protein